VPYFFSSAFILATIFLGFGLDKYARPEPTVVLERRRQVRSRKDSVELICDVGRRIRNRERTGVPARLPARGPRSAPGSDFVDPLIAQPIAIFE